MGIKGFLKINKILMTSYMDGLAGGFTALCLLPAKAWQLASQHLLQQDLIRLRGEDATIEAGTKVLEKLGCLNSPFGPSPAGAWQNSGKS